MKTKKMKKNHLITLSIVAIFGIILVVSFLMKNNPSENNAAVQDEKTSGSKKAEETTADAKEETEDQITEMIEGEGSMTIIIETSIGEIEAELYTEKAPITVGNFLTYIDEGFYEGTIFHRVIPGFMIQGGGFTQEMTQKQTVDPIKNEAGNGLKNVKYTLAMARTSIVDSATSQFFINVADNDFLDHKDDTAQGYGYAVFGKVIKGMDTADKIALVETTTKGPYQDVPVEPVVITRIYVKE